MRRTPLVIAALAMTALLAACDDPAEQVTTSNPGPAAGMCLEGATDCNDMGVSPEDATTAAESFLGLTQAELADDVRIARIGEEWFPVTEDYVIGRTTVELDPDADGTPRVTTVVIELEDGPITVTA